MCSNRGLSVLFAAVLGLSGCGGGGSGADNGPGVPEYPVGPKRAGVLAGPGIKGLHYETDTLSGLTGADGGFVYRTGETVRFSLGDIELGSAEGAPVLSPFDLLNLQAPTTESEIMALIGDAAVSSFDLVLNMTMLLYSLDSDRNPDNGIDLDRTHDAFSGLEPTEEDEISLAVKASGFEHSDVLAGLLQRAGKTSAVTLEYAASKLYQSLNLALSANLVRGYSASATDETAADVSVDYNDRGMVTRERRVPSDASDVIELIYEYDESGLLTQVSNSVTGTRSTLGYDHGRLSARLVVDADGQPQLRENYRYGEDGQLVGLEVDVDDDGVADERTSLEYGADGLLSAYGIDAGAEGQADITNRLHYQNGLLTSITSDSDGDGRTDVSISYGYDEDGRRISRDIQSSDPDLPSGSSTFDHDDMGRVIRYTTDTDRDGQAEYIEAYSHDYFGNRTEYRRDTNADGRWDFVALYRYDQDGNRIHMSEDSDGDGIVDASWNAEVELASMETDWASLLGAQ
jgi:hypothetical protein